MVAQGFIATGERVRLDEYFLEGPAIRSPAKDFQVSNSHWDSVPLIFLDDFGSHFRLFDDCLMVV